MGKGILSEVREYHYSWTRIIDCYVIPIAAVIVVITSAFVIVIYCKEYRTSKNKIRKVASLIYSVIGLSNIAAILPTAILHTYAFTYGNVKTFVPFNLCWTWFFVHEFTKVPHCASILFVTLLSLQRYQIIKHPFAGSQKWTVNKTKIKIIIALIVSTLISIVPFIGSELVPYQVECEGNITGINCSFTTCHAHFADWLGSYGMEAAIFIMILKFTTIILPSCLIILYCDISLIIYLKMITKVHHVMTHASKKVIHHVVKDKYKSVSNKYDKHEGHPQILLILILSSVVFIVEVPYTVLMFFQIYYWTLPSHESFTFYRIGPVRNAIDLTVVLSYPALFLASCVTSQRFRFMFRNLFKFALSK
ncbi:unnamed protein product [Mytilus edulis]|uniref:G-protein coupled receptors family 1 profile domain-containing protein n=1 Tax=Mytilus edulis TaxID=6550 RepID=A0A8S3SQR0_MYTED|nr:unnamed protein product [Mytilus edulis]